MNEFFVDNFNKEMQSSSSFKNVKRFLSNKRKRKRATYEKIPLKSADSDTSSEEEVVIHDLRHLKRQSYKSKSTSNLRKVKKQGTSTSEPKLDSDPFNNCVFVTLELGNGDTLQSLSLAYHCSVSDIKRANNLISNQEFYGLKFIKIPVKKHSSLHIPSVEAGSDSVILVPASPTTLSPDPASRCPSPGDPTTFFKKMDKNLEKIMLNTPSQEENPETESLLTTGAVAKGSVSAVDCSLQWNYLLAIIVVLAVVLPCGIALYMYTRPVSQTVHHNGSGIIGGAAGMVGS